jgi:hypothetical protein
MAPMRSIASIFRPALAIALSFWMAALACVLGCLQPALAHPVTSDQALTKTGSIHAGPSGHALNHEMDCCHRESPSAPADKQHSPTHDSISCCPLDARVTPTPKLNPPAAGIPFQAATISSDEFHFAFSVFSDPATLTHVFWHSGRDTLLNTHLLRI